MILFPDHPDELRSEQDQTDRNAQRADNHHPERYRHLGGEFAGLRGVTMVARGPIALATSFAPCANDSKAAEQISGR